MTVVVVPKRCGTVVGRVGGGNSLSINCTCLCWVALSGRCYFGCAAGESLRSGVGRSEGERAWTGAVGEGTRRGALALAGPKEGE